MTAKKLLLLLLFLLKIKGDSAFKTPPLRSHFSFAALSSKDARKKNPRTTLPHLSSDSKNHNNPTDRFSTTVASQAALIAGTTIGGGFLALPAATAPCGAAPAALGLIGVWLFLLGGALSLSNAIFIVKRTGTEEQAKDVSVFSLVRECFGGMAGTLCGVLFLLLVKVTLIAQLSKAGVLLEGAVPMIDRRLWTSLFSIAITSVCLVAKQRKIERLNDALTFTMLLSFTSLVALAGGSGWNPGGLKRADYKSLLPSFSSFSNTSNCSPWTIPIFIQLLIYNEVVPLVSSRLGDEHKVRRAIIFGSSVPLIMCIVWSCITLGLVPYETSMMDGMIYDPLTHLGDTILSKGGSIGRLFLMSVNALAGSAICTTVIGSILASTQYFDDVITNVMVLRRRIGRSGGRATPKTSAADHEANTGQVMLQQYRKLITHILSVAPSAVIAVWGSSNLYYRATSFAGEFPCTLLYGLIPPLCNLRIRWKLRNRQTEPTRTTTGKDVALQGVLATVSLLILVIAGFSNGGSK